MKDFLEFLGLLADNNLALKCERRLGGFTVQCTSTVEPIDLYCAFELKEDDLPSSLDEVTTLFFVPLIDSVNQERKRLATV